MKNSASFVIVTNYAFSPSKHLTISCAEAYRESRGRGSRLGRFFGSSGDSVILLLEMELGSVMIL